MYFYFLKLFINSYHYSGSLLLLYCMRDYLVVLCMLMHFMLFQRRYVLSLVWTVRDQNSLTHHNIWSAGWCLIYIQFPKQYLLHCLAQEDNKICYARTTLIYNKIYREKSISMIALWCPAFSNHGWLYQSCLKHNSLLYLLFWLPTLFTF